MLKVMIIDSDIKRSKPLKQSLIDSGFDVVAHVEDDINLQSKCLAINPDVVIDRKSTRLNSSHVSQSRMPSSA